MSNETKNVDLFDMDAEDASMSFLDKKQKNNDGIYRPNLKDAKDKAKGYIATIRFLPNLLEDGTIGPSAIEKHQHYVKLTDNPNLAGYYDCAKNKADKCDLCTYYWKLHNSKNQAEVERAELLNRSTKYYSYVQIIEDVQHPELVGKIMVFSYGIKIKNKINSERTGEITGEKCNVFDIANGKEFRLIIKEVGGFQNYETSSFREKSVIKLWNEDKSIFMKIPSEFDDTKNKNIITDAKAKNAIQKHLMKRDALLSEYESKDWTDEEKGKISQIIDIVSGNDITSASASIKNNNGTKKPATVVNDDLDDEDQDVDNFFEDLDS